MGGSTTGGAFAVAIQADGKIVVAGTNGADIAVARYTVDGQLDQTFNSGGSLKGTITIDVGAASDGAGSVAIDSAGRIVIGGFTGAGSAENIAVARLTAAGVLDASFNGTGKQVIDFGFGSDEVRSLVIDSTGIIAAGVATTSSLKYGAAMVRFKTDGTLDTAFGSGGKVTANFGTNETQASAVTIDSSGRIVLAGQELAASGVYDFAALRFSAAGVPDTSFNGNGQVHYDVAGGNGDDYAQGVAIDAQGRMLLTGPTFNAAHTLSTSSAIRLTTSGALDTTFGTAGIVRLPGATGTTARAIAISPAVTNATVGGTTAFFLPTAGLATDADVGDSVGYQTATGTGVNAGTVAVTATDTHGRSATVSYLSSGIAGAVYRDDNANQFHETTETTGLEGWSITATPTTGTAVTTVTDAAGNYAFPGLAAGTYTVTQVPPRGYSGWSQTYPLANGGRVVVVDQYTVVAAQDFLVSAAVTPIGNVGDQFANEGTPVTVQNAINFPGMPHWTVAQVNGTFTFQTDDTACTFTPPDNGTYLVTETVTAYDGSGGRLHRPDVRDGRQRRADRQLRQPADGRVRGHAAHVHVDRHRPRRGRHHAAGQADLCLVGHQGRGRLRPARRPVDDRVGPGLLAQRAG